MPITCTYYARSYYLVVTACPVRRRLHAAWHSTSRPGLCGVCAATSRSGLGEEAEHSRDK